MTKKRSMNGTNQRLMWHLRLGHASDFKIHKLEKRRFIGPFGSHPYPTCESCLKGKMTTSPFTGHFERANEVLGLIHIDVCGPIKDAAFGGFQYFITFTDDHSRYGLVYLMKYKSKALEWFKEF